jgi:hypothetical protein
MRKFLLQALILTVIVTGISEAARVTKPYTFSSGQTIKSADVNSDFDTMYSEFNGNIEGGASGNIKADSLTELEMADDVNPRVRWDEGFQDWIYTGLQPATAAGLTSNISAGTAYVNGYRANKASSTAHTYTNTKDTYIDIDYAGTFHYTEVAPLAAAPAVYTDSIRLAVAATRGGAITQVTDLRVLTPYATGTAHIIARGFELQRASTTTLTVLPGTLYHNLTRVDKTSSTTIDITSASAYIGGVSQQGTSRWLYVYVDSSGNILLEDSAPTYADASGGTTGTKLYAAYSGTYYRCIGAIRLNSTGSGEITNFFQDGNYIALDVPVSITTTVSAGAWSAATSCSAAIPSISTRALFAAQSDDTAGSVTQCNIRKNGTTYSSNVIDGQYQYSNGHRSDNSCQITSFTDSSQQIQYYNAAGTDDMGIDVLGYFINIR